MSHIPESEIIKRNPYLRRSEIVKFGPTQEGVWGMKCLECQHSVCGEKDPAEVEHADYCSLGDGTQGRYTKGL